MSDAAVRTRFAPSPTGELHVGSARTALFNWLFARHFNGEFVLRVEDTDTERSRKKFEDSILEDLLWLGLAWDEGPDVGGNYGPYRQSERIGIYRTYAENLVDAGAAYKCYCTKERLNELKKEQASRGLPPRYDGRCRNLEKGGAPEGITPVIRFMVPGKKVVFKDGVHGPAEFDTSDTGDFIIIASDGIAGYNFAAVVDDALMGITHILRGDDHLSNTPRQILLFEALGFKVPEFFHLPLVLGPDRTPLGKRHGGSTLAALRKGGYLPEAVVNALSRLGWSPDESISGLTGLTKAFDGNKLSRSPAVFDMDRLLAFNRAAISETPAEELMMILPESLRRRNKDRLMKIVDAVKGNAATMDDLDELVSPFTGEVHLTEEIRTELSGPRARKVLKALLEETEKILEFEGNISAETLSRVNESTGEKGKSLFMPIRLALTGQTHGIELSNVLDLLGKKRVAERLSRVTT